MPDIPDLAAVLHYSPDYRYHARQPKKRAGSPMQTSPSFRQALRLSAFLALSGLVSAPPAHAESPKDKGQRPEGGIEFQMPQSPELTPLRVGYIREMVEAPRAASRLDIEPED